MNINISIDKRKEINSRIKKSIGKGLAIAVLSASALAGAVSNDINTNKNLKLNPEYSKLEDLEADMLILQNNSMKLEEVFGGHFNSLSQKDVISSFQEKYASFKSNVSLIEKEKNDVVLRSSDFRSSYNASLLIDAGVFFTAALTLIGVCYGLGEANDSNNRRSNYWPVKNYRSP